MGHRRYHLTVGALAALAALFAGCGGHRHAPVRAAHPQPQLELPVPLECNASRTICLPAGQLRQPTPPRNAATPHARYGLDHAWGQLSPAAVRAFGGDFVIGYLSYDRAKNLARTEIRSLSAAGIQVALVWESTADRAFAGYAACRSDALEALRQARADGEPDQEPIYFAVDSDTTGIVGRIVPCFRGIHSVLGQRTGDYGGLATVEGLARAHLAFHHWQTLAWSPRWSGYACVEQYSIDHFIAGVGVDYNRAYCDFGGWRLGQKPPLPKPKPTSQQFAWCGQLRWDRRHGHGHWPTTLDLRSSLVAQRIACPDHTAVRTGPDPKPPAVTPGLYGSCRELVAWRRGGRRRAGRQAAAKRRRVLVRAHVACLPTVHRY